MPPSMTAYTGNPGAESLAYSNVDLLYTKSGKRRMKQKTDNACRRSILRSMKEKKNNLFEVEDDFNRFVT